jgi:hypothetical protein
MRWNHRLSAFVLLTTVCLPVPAAFAGGDANVDAFQLPMAEPLPLNAPSAKWALPPAERMGDEVEVAPAMPVGKKIPRRFDASISASDAPNAVAARIDALLEAALQNDGKTKDLDKAVTHYRSKTQVAIAQAKDTADYVIPYRGFGMSIEAGNLILDENVKVHSRASAEYARQRHIDDLHVKVVSNTMQIAMGLGMSDQTKGAETVEEGYEGLKELVGVEEADRTLSLLRTWVKELDIPEAAFTHTAWNVKERQEKLKVVLSSALESDAVLHEITKRVHKYNRKSKFARVSAQIVQSVLAAASLTPTFVGPAAKTALVTFVMATGGPESCKLLKELYLDKRFESRWKVLNEEAHMALENYHIAMLTHNPVLLACSESLIDQMSGGDTVHSVLGRSVLPKQAVASKEPAAL